MYAQYIQPQLNANTGFHVVEVSPEQTHFIVTFHYRGVTLSLILAVQPGGSTAAGLSD